MAILLNRYSAL